MYEYVIFNGRKDNSHELAGFEATDRGYRYGDGLFETMVYKNGALRFWDDHFGRLAEGMRLLKMEVASLPAPAVLLSEINLFIEAQAWAAARVRLIVWRKSGGMYTPVNAGANYLLMFSPLALTASAPLPTNAKAGFAKNITVSFSSISHLKTCNALPYIIASAEKEEQGWADAFLLNNDGFVAESTHSNIFWYKEGLLYTPALASGCIAGVLRKNILKSLREKGLPCEEILAYKAQLLSAEVVFTSNASGLHFFSEIENIQLQKAGTEAFIQSPYFASIAPLL